MEPLRRVSRRSFLRQAAAAVVGPLMVPASALGKDGAAAPSERITMAAIGLGGRGRSDWGHFLLQPDVQGLAVCDCFADRRRDGKAMVDGQYKTKDCAATRLHEEVLGRPDIDAVLLATGDRWHGVLSMLAARAGKDVYSEKPATLTIAEGRALVETTRRYGTIWQCGTQRRSNDAYRFVALAVRSGMIGRLHTITALLGSWGGNGVARPEPAPDPEVFDYDRWLGQAPWAPYSSVRVGLWRNHWDLAGGVIADMGAHYFDFAQWAHDSEMTGPVEYEGTGAFPDDGFANVPFDVNVQARYADGVRLLIRSGDKGVRFDGDQGWIHLSDDGTITAEPKSILKAQRSVYCVRTAEHIRQRIALDMERDQRAPHRIATVHTLHLARSENKSPNNDATVSKKVECYLILPTSPENRRLDGDTRQFFEGAPDDSITCIP